MISKTKEIGGYFGLENLINKPYHKDAIALNTGRNAIVYLAKSKNIKKLCLPYFLCDSVANVCDRENISYDFYNIDEKFCPIFDTELSDGEYLYIVNFYGQITNEYIESLKDTHKRIIVDNTHAFFQKPIKGLDTIYSCRKFFGVPDGAYLYTDAVLDEKIPEDYSADRMGHILGRFENSASGYYSVFKRNDDSFEKLELRKMSALTQNIMGAISYENVVEKRNTNFRILKANLDMYNKLEVKEVDGPYCYPFYCENGMAMKSELAKKNVYIATLWPNVANSDQSLEKDFAENILPLPCDQRYGKEEMAEMIEYIMSMRGETWTR